MKTQVFAIFAFVSVALTGLTGCVSDVIPYQTAPDSGDPTKDSGNAPDVGEGGMGADSADGGMGSDTGQDGSMGQDGSSTDGSMGQDGGTDSGMGCDGGNLMCGNVCVDSLTDNNNCGGCGIACGGGDTCNAGYCTQTLVFEATNQLALSLSGNNVYFSNSANKVEKCGKNGCGNQPTVLATNQNNPTSLATDSTDAYWTNYQGGSLSTVPLGGGSTTNLATNQMQPYSVAVDANGVYMYWAEFFFNASVKRCLISNCANTTTALAMGTQASAISVDSTNVYWYDFAAKRILKCAVGGCSGNPTILVNNQSSTNYTFTDGSNLYWASLTSVYKCATNGCGGNPTVLASNQNANAIAVVTDGSNAYWTDKGGTVQKCALNNCANTITLLAVNQNQPGAIAVDSQHVFWTNYAGGQIMRAPK